MDSITLFGETLSLPLTDEGRKVLTIKIASRDSDPAAVWEALKHDKAFPAIDRIFLLTLCVEPVLNDETRDGWCIARSLMANALRLARQLEPEAKGKALAECAWEFHENLHDNETALVLLNEAESLGADVFGANWIRREAAISACFRRDWERCFSLVQQVHGWQTSEDTYSDLGDWMLEMGEIDQALRLAEIQGSKWDHHGPLHLKILQYVLNLGDQELAQATLDKITPNPIGLAPNEIRFCQRVLDASPPEQAELLKKLNYWMGFGTLGEEVV